MDEAQFRERTQRPDLQAIRERALKAVIADIDAVLSPHGYTRKNTIWLRSGWFWVTYLELQKSRYGFGCFINLGRDLRHGGVKTPSYRNNTSWRLAQVAAAAEAPTCDEFHYVDLDRDPALRQHMIDRIVTWGIPFLRRCHGPLGHLARPTSPRPRA